MPSSKKYFGIIFLYFCKICMYVNCAKVYLENNKHIKERVSLFEVLFIYFVHSLQLKQNQIVQNFRISQSNIDPNNSLQVLSLLPLDVVAHARLST